MSLYTNYKIINIDEKIIYKTSQEINKELTDLITFINDNNIERYDDLILYLNSSLNREVI